MTTRETFDKHNSECIKFDLVQKKLSSRPDIHAFLLLDSMFPGTSDIIDGASHDEIYLSVPVDDLLMRATEDQVVELIRCGVRYDSFTDSLAIFV